MIYELQNTSINNARFPRRKLYSKTKKTNLKKKHIINQSSTKSHKKVTSYATNYTTNYATNSTSNKLSSLTLNNLVHYKKIFQHNRKMDKTIILLKKIEFDIFYSCKRKYPLLVKETITPLTGTTDPNELSIDRRVITDPFREDADIPAEYRHTLEDYKSIMSYGGSMGHNAPAGQHKTNMKVYSETFLLSNITPQEMVFNSYEIASATLVNGIFTTALKLSVQRERPFDSYPTEITKYTKAGSHSFPSGHTSMAFATATSISLLYPKWYIIAPSFIWASSMGYSRMYLGVHYPSDVLILNQKICP